MKGKRFWAAVLALTLVHPDRLRREGRRPCPHRGGDSGADPHP